MSSSADHTAAEGEGATFTLGGDFPYAALTQPTDVGPYHVVEVVGEGGMGVVYKAEQREPVRRVVALKLIKLGMDTREVIARFESERQALAMMSHPNVARVLDAGATESGRPYFVMEFVAGEPITAYCDKNHLTVRQRLELFTQACAALEHAHQKALIHRDVKPSNILVTRENDKPTVKVIDFGVAKATNQRLTDRTVFTHRGQLIGTPEYMSPEQAEMSGVDVDTRTDIYSLGVVLYELLTGLLPFDAKSLRSAAFNEIQRIIREVDPPRPSTRVSTLGASAVEIAMRRRTQVEALSRQLKSELEWIPLKAMRKDPAQRYRTVSELAADVQNYLENRPLSAGPESVGYRARKFVRRNKGPVAAATAVLVVLVAGIVGTSVGFVRAERQRRDAVAARDSAEAVNQFLTKDVIGSADPAVMRGRELTVREALDNAAQRIGRKFTNTPLVEANVRSSVAGAYESLGRSDLALPHAQSAMATRRALLGDDHPDTLRAIMRVGQIELQLGHLPQAEALWREALDRARRARGEDDKLTLDAYSNVGGLLQEQGRYADAEPMHRAAERGHRRVLGDAHPETLTSINNLAYLLHLQRRFDEAEPLYREALAGRRKALGDDHPLTITSVGNLGVLLMARGQLAEAEPLYREALDARRRVLGDDHPDTLLALNNMAYLLLEQKRGAEAEAAFRETLERRQRVHPPDHPMTLVSMHNLAGVLKENGNLAEAEPLARQALQRRQRVLGEDHPDTLASRHMLVGILIAQGEIAQAEPLAREAYEKFLAVSGPRHPGTIASARNLAKVLMAQGKPEQAEPLLREAYERLRESGQSGSIAMRQILESLVSASDAMGRADQAHRWRAELSALHPATSPTTRTSTRPQTAPVR